MFGHNSLNINISGTFLWSLWKIFFCPYLSNYPHYVQKFLFLWLQWKFVIIMKNRFFWTYLLNYQHYGQKNRVLWSLWKIVFSLYLLNFQHFGKKNLFVIAMKSCFGHNNISGTFLWSLWKIFSLAISLKLSTLRTKVPFFVIAMKIIF